MNKSWTAKRLEEEKLFREQYATFTLEELKAEKKKFENEANALWTKSSMLAPVIEELAIAEFKKQNHLDKYKWSVELDYNSKNKIHLAANESDDYHLSKIMGSDNMYHFRHELEPGIKLHSDDRELTITFDDQTKIIPFIKEWNLTVDCKVLDDIEKESREALKNVASLRKIVHKI